jgi:hypothetical protein
VTESRLLRSYYAFQFFFSSTFYQAIFFVFYAEQVGLTAAAVLSLQSYYLAMRAAFELPAGALADRWSRRGCLVCAGLAISAGAALMVSFPSLPTAVAGETLLAIGAALRSGVDSALLYDGLTSLGAAERYPRAEGRGQAVAAIGSGLAAIAGGALASFDVRLAYYGTLLMMLGAAAVAGGLRGGEVAAARRAPAWQLIASAAREVANSARIRWVMALAIFAVVFSHVYFYGQQPLLLELGVPVLWFGFLFAAVKGVTSVVATQAYRLDAALGERGATVVMIAITILGLGALSFTGSAWGALLLLSRGLFDGLWQPLIQVYLNRQAASELRATLLSLQNLASRLALASVVGGFGFATAQLGLTATFGLAAATAAIAGTLLVVTASRD